MTLSINGSITPIKNIWGVAVDSFVHISLMDVGDNPLTSAVNRFGQIHGIHGLYVADGSGAKTSR